MKKTSGILLLCIVLVGIFSILTYLDPVNDSSNGNEKKELEQEKRKYKYTVVIDAGHGGVDPGKVGFNGIYEMDINLAIAYKLSDILDEENVKVVMTRKDDNGLYKDSDTNKKMADMNSRIDIINKSEANLVVSIHQNSFTSSEAKGAQVFYYKESQKGEMLAECIQGKLKLMDETNTRDKKNDGDYYILKKSNPPAVIVECGFLSNEEETKLLSTGEYQEKVAKAIALGVKEYLREYE